MEMIEVKELIELLKNLKNDERIVIEKEGIRLEKKEQS